MGLAFSIDSPIRVARFGISSVISLSDDGLIEQVRELYSRKFNRPYQPINSGEEDYRARRITAYLNLVHDIVQQQMHEMARQEFTETSELTKYFRLLPHNAILKQLYQHMLFTEDLELKLQLQTQLRASILPGSIDVNIMTKLDKTNYTKSGEALPPEYSDAMAGLRGFAQSDLQSSVVFSAGMNPRVYSYMEQFADFLPNQNGELKKKIIIKVSDYRSAAIQGKVLAKKGLWVSEFRIESGLNCGGHAFATDGYLLGPILEEFKQNREQLRQELYAMYTQALAAKNMAAPAKPFAQKLTVQGGIGTAKEHNFLLQYFGADATGWGTPFLLVPEASSVDEATLQKLVNAQQADLYLSNISPLGVPFNSLRDTTSEAEKQARIAKGNPGSPCVKKHLVSNTEFTEQAICTASSKYQKRKIAELNLRDLPAEDYNREFAKITEKECLCEGLSKTVLIENNAVKRAQSKAVAICPGPNLAWFSGVFSLEQMVDHIYGRTNLLNQVYRPNMFVNELRMYVQYLKKQIPQSLEEITDKKLKYLNNFRSNLQTGIAYYQTLVLHLTDQTEEYRGQMAQELNDAATELESLQFTPAEFVAFSL